MKKNKKKFSETSGCATSTLQYKAPTREQRLAHEVLQSRMAKLNYSLIAIIANEFTLSEAQKFYFESQINSACYQAFHELKVS